MAEAITAAAAAPTPPEDFVASLAAASVAKDPATFAAVCARVAASVLPVSKADGFRNTCWRIPGLLVVELHRKDGHSMYAVVDDTEVSWHVLKKRTISYSSRGYACYRHGQTRDLHAYIYGDVPDGQNVDHVDRIRLNDVGANLRAVSHSVNAINSKTRTDNTSGVPGVSRYGRGWQATWMDADHEPCCKYFSCRKYGGSGKALAAAVAHRGRMVATLPDYVLAHSREPVAVDPPEAPPAARPALGDIRVHTRCGAFGVGGLTRDESKRCWCAAWNSIAAGEIRRRSFHDSVHGGMEGAKTAAIACLLEIAKVATEDLLPKTGLVTGDPKPLAPRGSSGVIGISRDGPANEWTVTWRSIATGKIKCKSFPDSVHGSMDNAKTAAIAYLLKIANVPTVDLLPKTGRVAGDPPPEPARGEGRTLASGESRRETNGTPRGMIQ